MTKMMIALLVCLVGSTVACSGADAEDEGNADEANVSAPKESNLPPVTGGEVKAQGLRPAIRDGVNGPCAGPVCGGGIKPSPNVWN